MLDTLIDQAQQLVDTRGRELDQHQAALAGAEHTLLQAAGGKPIPSLADIDLRLAIGSELDDAHLVDLRTQTQILTTELDLATARQQRHAPDPEVDEQHVTGRDRLLVEASPAPVPDDEPREKLNQGTGQADQLSELLARLEAGGRQDRDEQSVSAADTGASANQAGSLDDLLDRLNAGADRLQQALGENNAPDDPAPTQQTPDEGRQM